MGPCPASEDSKSQAPLAGLPFTVTVVAFCSADAFVIRLEK